MSRSWAIAAVLAAATAGCSVPYNAPLPPEQTDTCSSTVDCAAGAACTSGVCVATQVDLAGLELDVLPDSTAAYGAGSSFLFDLAGKAPLALGAANTTPFATAFDANLPSPIAIQGGQFLVNPSMAVEPGCPLVGGSLPGVVTFYPVLPFAGPPVVAVSATTSTTNDGANVFNQGLVPAAGYDIYFQPAPVKGCNGGKALPPVFLSNQPVIAGAPLWTLPAAGTFTGTITSFDTAGPVGSVWTAAVVDPTWGLVISSEAGLACAAGVCSFTVQLAWGGSTTVPILRLTPPNPNEPTIYWSLAGTPLTPGSNAEFSAAGLVVQPVEVTGKVTDTTGTTGVQSVLSIQSTSLSGTVQQNASLQIDGAQTDSHGTFSVLLPPGAYQIRAFPLDGTLAVTTRSIMVASDMISQPCDCEPVVLPLEPQISVTGTVTTPRGAPIANAQVGFSPSQVVGASYWTTTHALDAVDGQSAKATTDQDGHFELMVDPGSSEVTVAPDPNSGFPWLVLPSLTVQTAPPPLSLAIQSPAVLQGVVRDPSGNPVAAAVVNAWVPMFDASGVATGTGVQIATTSTGADGSYTLLLPPSL